MLEVDVTDFFLPNHSNSKPCLFSQDGAGVSSSKTSTLSPMPFSTCSFFLLRSTTSRQDTGRPKMLLDGVASCQHPRIEPADKAESMAKTKSKRSDRSKPATPWNGSRLSRAHPYQEWRNVFKHETSFTRDREPSHGQILQSSTNELHYPRIQSNKYIHSWTSIILHLVWIFH